MAVKNTIATIAVAHVSVSVRTNSVLAATVLNSSLRFDSLVFFFWRITSAAHPQVRSYTTTLSVSLFDIFATFSCVGTLRRIVARKVLTPEGLTRSTWKLNSSLQLSSQQIIVLSLTSIRVVLNRVLRRTYSISKNLQASRLAAKCLKAHCDIIRGNMSSFVSARNVLGETLNVLDSCLLASFINAKQRARFEEQVCLSRRHAVHVTL